MERSAAAPGTARPAARPRERRADARERLIAHATRIFAAKGYAAASTREICEAAGANVAAIHYHFGDKEGLYRAVLSAPIEAMAARFGRFDDPALDFGQAMRVLLRPFVAMALDEDPAARDVLRLHLREALEPTDVFRDVVDRIVVPLHRALAALLARHCGLAAPDAGLHQLGFAIVAMASDYCTSREFIRRVAPELLDDDAASRIVERLAGYGSALLAHEIASRRAGGTALSNPTPGGRP